IDLAGRLAIALKNFASITVDARGFGRNVRILIQQLAERHAVRFPTTHPLGRQFNNEDRCGEARRFGVEENPGLAVHASCFGTGLSGSSVGPKYFSSSLLNSGILKGLEKNVTSNLGSV